MALEQQFLNEFAVEATEMGSRPTERSNQRKLRNYQVRVVADLLRKRQTTFGFALHLLQRIARGEQVRVEHGVRVVHKREIATLGRGVESAAPQVNGAPHVFHIRHDHRSQTVINACLEAPQSAAINELITDLAESIRRSVIAEALYC